MILEKDAKITEFLFTSKTHKNCQSLKTTHQQNCSNKQPEMDTNKAMQEQDPNMKTKQPNRKIITELLKHYNSLI